MEVFIESGLRIYGAKKPPKSELPSLGPTVLLT